eukprot:m.171599 g.171599  ORF g.171599 m.171599 type:complete len:469 (+) comp13395_c0_seq1:2783-4189(+)
MSGNSRGHVPEQPHVAVTDALMASFAAGFAVPLIGTEEQMKLFDVRNEYIRVCLIARIGMALDTPACPGVDEQRAQLRKHKEILDDDKLSKLPNLEELPLLLLEAASVLYVRQYNGGKQEILKREKPPPWEGIPVLETTEECLLWMRNRCTMHPVNRMRRVVLRLHSEKDCLVAHTVVTAPTRADMFKNVYTLACLAQNEIAKEQDSAGHVHNLYDPSHLPYIPKAKEDAAAAYKGTEDMILITRQSDCPPNHVVLTEAMLLKHRVAETDECNARRVFLMATSWAANFEDLTLAIKCCVWMFQIVRAPGKLYAAEQFYRTMLQVYAVNLSTAIYRVMATKKKRNGQRVTFPTWPKDLKVLHSFRYSLGHVAKPGESLSAIAPEDNPPQHDLDGCLPWLQPGEADSKEKQDVFSRAIQDLRKRAQDNFNAALGELQNMISYSGLRKEPKGSPYDDIVNLEELMEKAHKH